MVPLLQSERPYSILLTLYDPSLALNSLAEPQPFPSSFSLDPLLPNTRHKLPSHLDRQLEQTLHQLVLPPSQRDFWSLTLTPNHRAPSRDAPLLQSSPPAAALHTPATHVSTTNPRIWSQNFFSPTSFPSTSPSTQLWTPSLPLPSLSSSYSRQSGESRSGTEPTQKKQQRTPVLDFRFGPLRIDWIRIRIPYTPETEMSEHQATAGKGDLPLAAEEGTTSLNWGTIHLYRQQHESDPSGSEDVAPRDSSQLDEDQDKGIKNIHEKVGDGKTLGMISVPGNLNATSILYFINSNTNDQAASKVNDSTILDGIEEIRMLRDSTPSRSIVLIKFRTVDFAKQFIADFNGRRYYDSKDSEICQVVTIGAISIKTTSLPPYVFPVSPDPSLAPPTRNARASSKPPTRPRPNKDSNKPSLEAAGQSHNTSAPLIQQRSLQHEGQGAESREIPTCPICLERLDSKVTGLIQISCKHSYHCNCLLRWGDSRCPVCRATNLRPRLPSSTSTEGGLSAHVIADQGAQAEDDSKLLKTCTICLSPSNLWICIICGNVGCGRYQGAHAASHYLETGHSYSLELQTGRIWSYADDEYVHRLLRIPSTNLNHNHQDQRQPDDPHSVTSSRLIELPSLPSLQNPRGGGGGGGGGDGVEEDLSQKIASSYQFSSSREGKGGGEGMGGGGGPDRSTEEEQDKLESIAIEYSTLLRTNLDEQRSWFEQELARTKHVSNEWEKRVTELETRIEKSKLELSAERKEVERRERGTSRELQGLKRHVERLDRELSKSQEERKKDRVELTQSRKLVERELEQERSVTEHLSSNLVTMRQEIESRRNETRSVQREVDELKDQLNDLMAALTMRDQIEREPEGSELRGATIGVFEPERGTQGGDHGKSLPSEALRDKRKKKPKKKK